MVSAKKRGLGKGLDALLAAQPKAQASPDGAAGNGVEGEQILQLDPRAIRPNPKQPRTTFAEEPLVELAESIRRNGVQEPVVVRNVGGTYELVTGERRVRACVMADLDSVPAICRDVSDEDMLRLGVIENIQREDLNAIELANAYQQLIREFEWTQEELAEQVGKKRVTVTNTLRLLNLPAEVQRCVAEQEITMGHARALLALATPEAQSRGCRRIIEQGLSVRQTEKLASPNRDNPKPVPKDPNLVSLEDELRRNLGTRVTVRSNAKNRGKIEIDFYNLDDLERILDLLRSTH